MKYFTSNKIAIAQMCEREYGRGPEYRLVQCIIEDHDIEAV